MTRPSWTIAESAERCGVSRSTVRRYRESDKFPNAWKDSAGAWKIPLEDLLAVGWAPVDPAQSAPPEPAPDRSQDRIAELERALELERVRRESAEQLAAQTQANLTDLRTALKMLEGAAVSAPPAPAEQPVALPPERGQVNLHGQATEPPEQPTRRRWWIRS